jgi:OOP family OmpA-OmpF porin
MKSRTAVVAAAGLTAALAGSAAWSQDAPGFYVGGSLGQVEHQEGCEGATISCDQKDSSWKIYGGYQFNRHLAVEGGYADLGETTASGVLSGVNVNATFEVTAWELVGIGSFPVMERLSLLGKIGFYRAEVDANATGSVPGFSATRAEKENNTGTTFGFGASYDISRNFSVRAEWQRYQDVGGDQVGESDIDVLGVGLIFRF